MLKYLNTKKIKTNFLFTSTTSGRKIASREIFCYGRNFFLTVRSLLTVSGFALAWFSSLSSKRLCVFGLNGDI